MEDLQKFWDSVVNYLETVEKISTNLYQTFVRDARPIKITDEEVYIEVPQEIHKRFWEQTWIEKVTLVSYEVFDKPLMAKIVLPGEIQSETQQEIQENSVPNDPIQEAYTKFFDKPNDSPLQNIKNAGLRQDYTFDTFVLGDGNRFAHAASLAVATEPGKDYNPLFIFGGVGLGKTHLAQAIGNELLKTKSYSKVKYVTAETFLNDYTNSIRKNNMDFFQNEYRTLDLLIVDDIQFFNTFKNDDASKAKEVFFNTFNALHDNDRQIVLISDRTPKELNNLEDRLISRFEWGMNIDITAPDFETRYAILKNKAESSQIDIPDETLRYLANQFSDNVRELEGALRRVHFYATSKGEDISTHLAAEAIVTLKNGSTSNKTTTIEEIQKTVTTHYRISLQELKGKIRSTPIVVPRQIAMYLSKEMTGSSYPRIAAEFGGRDHSTVMHAVKKIKKILDDGSDENLRREIETIKKKLS